VLVILMAVASTFQIPAAAVLMLPDIDTLMDMGRTAMNVIGNCLAAAVVARWEGELTLPQELTTSKELSS
jgi:proton glutamate symport protein